MGMQHAMIVTRHRRLCHFAAMSEKINEARVDITPEGMVRSDASTPENPRPEMINPPNVVKPVQALAYSLCMTVQVFTSVGNIDGDVEKEENPCLGVEESFLGLIHLEFLVYNTRFVLG